MKWSPHVWSPVERQVRPRMSPYKQSVVGIEYSWLAVDEVGYVGLFTTAGEGPVPETALPKSERDLETEERIHELRECSECELHIQYPRPDDYISTARRGIFSFDWAEINETKSGHMHRYRLIAEPKSPLKLSDLPLEFQKRASATRISGVLFRNSSETGVKVQ